MKIGFVGQGKLEDFQNTIDGGGELILFSFDCMGEVSYEKEDS